MKLNLHEALEASRQRRKDFISVVLGAIVLGFAINLTSSSIFALFNTSYMPYITSVFILFTSLIGIRLYRYFSQQSIQYSFDLEIEFYAHSTGEVNSTIKPPSSGLCFYKGLSQRIDYIFESLKKDDTNIFRKDHLDGQLLMYIVLREIIGQTGLLMDELHYKLKLGADINFFRGKFEIPQYLIKENIFLSTEYGDDRSFEFFPNNLRVEFLRTHGYNENFYLIRMIHPFGTIEIDNILTYLNYRGNDNTDDVFYEYLKIKGITKEGLISLDGDLRLTLHLNPSRSYDKNYESFLFWLQYITNAFQSSFSWDQKENHIANALLTAACRKLDIISGTLEKKA